MRMSPSTHPYTCARRARVLPHGLRTVPRGWWLRHKSRSVSPQTTTRASAQATRASSVGRADPADLTVHGKPRPASRKRHAHSCSSTAGSCSRSRAVSVAVFASSSASIRPQSCIRARPAAALTARGALGRRGLQRALDAARLWWRRPPLTPLRPLRAPATHRGPRARQPPPPRPGPAAAAAPRRTPSCRRPARLAAAAGREGRRRPAAPAGPARPPRAPPRPRPPPLPRPPASSSTAPSTAARPPPPAPPRRQLPPRARPAGPRLARVE
jgi:hypothetical protein